MRSFEHVRRSRKPTRPGVDTAEETMIITCCNAFPFSDLARGPAR